MTTTDPTLPEVKNTTGDLLANGRKAAGAGVAAAFAAAVPVLGTALTDGVLNGDELGTIAAAGFGALLSVGYVTWQTVNRPTPKQEAQFVQAVDAAAHAVPPIVVQGVDPALVEYVGAPDLPVEVRVSPTEGMSEADVATLAAQHVNWTPVGNGVVAVTGETRIEGTDVIAGKLDLSGPDDDEPKHRADPGS